VQRDSEKASNTLLNHKKTTGAVNKCSGYNLGDYDPEVWTRLPYWVKELILMLKENK
jgi:hypothetical protein